MQGKPQTSLGDVRSCGAGPGERRGEPAVSGAGPPDPATGGLAAPGFGAAGPNRWGFPGEHKRLIRSVPFLPARCDVAGAETVRPPLFRGFAAGSSPVCTSSSAMSRGVGRIEPSPSRRGGAGAGWAGGGPGDGGGAGGGAAARLARQPVEPGEDLL